VSQNCWWCEKPTAIVGPNILNTVKVYGTSGKKNWEAKIGKFQDPSIYLGLQSCSWLLNTGIPKESPSRAATRS
jgi:hypothetical protein